MINVQHDTENRGRMSVHLTCGLESNKPVTVLNFNKTAEPDPSNRRSASKEIVVYDFCQPGSDTNPEFSLLRDRLIRQKLTRSKVR